MLNGFAIGWTQACGAAFQAFALGHAAVDAGFHCDIESHAATDLHFGVDAVNDAHDDRAEGGLAVLHDLTGGIALVDDQHAVE